MSADKIIYSTDMEEYDKRKRNVIKNTCAHCKKNPLMKGDDTCLLEMKDPSSPSCIIIHQTLKNKGLA